MSFGRRLRELRRQRGLTLRKLADAAGVNFSYLSKIENDRIPYTPAPDTIRRLAGAMGVDPLELLGLANKLPPELESLNASAPARRFFERARQVASPDDWNALLDFLEQRQAARSPGGGDKEQ